MGPFRNFGDRFPSLITEADLYPRPEVIPPARPGGVIGTIPGIIGCMEAAEVIKIITGYGEVLSGKLFLLDTQTLQHEIIEI